MTVMYALLALALGVGAVLGVIVIEELRWETSSRVSHRTSYREVHYRHAGQR